MSKYRKHLYIFIAITLSCGWIGVLIDSILTDQPEGDSLGMGLWLFLPFLISIIFHKKEHEWKSIGLLPVFKGNIRWYILSISLYPVVTLLCISLAMIFHCISFSDFTLKSFLSVAIFTVVASFIKNIFEEFSWRGYLVPRLIATGLNDWGIYLISGMIWGLWHSAYYIVFLPNDFFITYSRYSMLIIGCILMTIWSVMFVELYRLTKSVWPCVLMHVFEDAVPTVLVSTGEYVSFSNTGSSIFDPITGIIATIIFLTSGFILRYVRIKRDLQL